MSQVAWPAVLNPQTAPLNGPGLTNSAAAADISYGGNQSGQAFVFPAGYVKNGQAYRFTAAGFASTTGTPTLQFFITVGGVAGITVAKTAIIATNSNLSDAYWYLQATGVTGGGGGSTSWMETEGMVVGPYASAAVISYAGADFNAANANIVTIGAQWGTASASNSIFCDWFIIERLI